MSNPDHDFKVADLSLAAFGRKEIELAERDARPHGPAGRVRRQQAARPAPASPARCT